MGGVLRVLSACLVAGLASAIWGCAAGDPPPAEGASGRTDDASLNAPLPWASGDPGDPTLHRRTAGLLLALGSVKGVRLQRHFTWSDGIREWEWNLELPLRVYAEDVRRPRPVSYRQWATVARVGAAGDYLSELADGLRKASEAHALGEYEEMMLVVSLVQSLAYRSDSDTTGRPEYVRYPMETLFEGGGDCEDKVILAAALLDRLGYDVAVLILENERHAALGVVLPEPAGVTYHYAGKRYVYLETGRTGWRPGGVPETISDTTALVLPLAE